MENVSPEEQHKFTTLADDWWDPNGNSRALHDINQCRFDYVATRIELNDARVADIGCGGGILSESLAAAGAEVVAIDATSAVIEVAQRHAATSALSIDYRVQLSDSLATAEPMSYDAVVCMELIEHVPDPAALVRDCHTLLKPGGRAFFSTLTRTALAYALGIVAAEYILNLVPRGTHDYEQFLKPSELAQLGRDAGLSLTDISAMHYNPVTRQCRLGGRVNVNYLASFTRD